MDSKFVFWRWL